MSPVLAGAARAKADKVVAAAWSARLMCQLGPAGGRKTSGTSWMQRSPMAPL